MSFYKVTTSATSNASANVDDQFIEIVLAASSRVKIHRVEVGVGTAAQDHQSQVKFIINTAAGSGGTAATVTKLDANSRAASFTANQKNTTTPFSLGTGTSTLEQNRVNTRATWRWTASPSDPPIYVNGGNFFCVVIQSTGTSIVHTVTVVVED